MKFQEHVLLEDNCFNKKELYRFLLNVMTYVIIISNYNNYYYYK